MPIEVTCACKKQLTLRSHLAGKKIRCPDCDEVVQVPGGRKKPRRKVVKKRTRPQKPKSDPWDLDQFGVQRELPSVVMPAPVAPKKKRKQPDYVTGPPRNESNDGGFHIDSAIVHMLIGGLICFAGVALTAFSLNSESGGGYIYYGAIVVGGIQFFRGLFDAIS